MVWRLRSLLLALLCPLAAGQFCASDYASLTVFQLREFMATPFAPVWESAEAMATGVFDFLGGAESHERWFLHQIRVHEPLGNGYMIYAGMEDGQFSGYGLSGKQFCSTPGEPRCTTWYTQRKAGRARPQDYHWRSLAEKFGASAPWQHSACATGRSDELYGCRADPSWARTCTDQLSCQAHETTDGTTCALEAACKTQHKVGGTWETRAGVYLAQSCVDATSAAASIEFAQQTCGHSDCVDITSDAEGFLPGCQDYDVRLYYSVGCRASELQNDRDLCEDSGATCSVDLPPAFSLQGVDSVSHTGNTVVLSSDDATDFNAGQILTLGHASGSSDDAITNANVASIDESAANTVTLTTADSTIAAGQVLRLSSASGVLCSAQPLNEDLIVASVDGAVITFATDLTAGDLSANANCLIGRQPPCPARSAAQVASIDESAANTVTLTTADSTIVAGQVLQLSSVSGVLCSAQPLNEDLIVASVDGAVITFATDLTAGDLSANANCVITRAAPFPLTVDSYSARTITIDTSTTSIVTSAATAGSCVISRAKDERQCNAYAGNWAAPCSFTIAPLTSSEASIASIDIAANSITLSNAASSFVPGQRLRLADKAGQTCAAQPKGSDLVVASVQGSVIELSTALTGSNVNAASDCVITRASSCAEATPGRSADAGAHTDRPYRWRSYDPRYRLWYRQAKERFVATGTKESWSDVYLFASGQGMGLTAMRVVSDATWCEGGFCGNCAAAAVGPQTIAANGIDVVANTITLDSADSDITAGQTLRLSSASGQTCAATPLDDDLIVESVDGAVITLTTRLTNGDGNANVHCQVTHNGARCRATDARCVGNSLAKQAAATRLACESIDGTWIEPCVYSDAGDGTCTGTPFAGVLAVDYSLDTLRNWLQTVIPISDDVVVWVMDQSSGEETPAGTVIAASQGFGLDSTTHSNLLVRKSSEYLSQKFGPYGHWPAAYENSSSPTWLATAEGGDTVRRFDIQVESLGDTRGLNWLVVVAAIKQDQCERPKRADRNHLKCECKSNYRSKIEGRDDEASDCVFCKSDVRICCEEASKVDQKCEPRKTGCINCHGGSLVTAQRGFFLLQEPGKSLQVFRCLDHLCLGTADSSNGTNIEPRCPENSENMTDGNCCRKGHMGPLCGLCKEGYAWSDDMICVPCTSPNLPRVLMIISSLLLFITYSVLSKHYLIVKRVTSDKFDKNTARAELTKLSSCCRIPKTSWCFLLPLGNDLPETGGSELQTLTFWMQAFTLLEIDGNESWWWILSMAFHFKPASGVKVCPMLLTPFEKWWVDVFGPTIFLLSVGLIMHFLICLHMAYRSGSLPCSCSVRKKIMVVHGINDKSEDDLTKLFNGMKQCPGFVTHTTIRYRYDNGTNTSWALVIMSEVVDIARVTAGLDQLKRLDSDSPAIGISVSKFDSDVARSSVGGMHGVYRGMTFRAHFWRQSHKLKAVILDVGIYSLMPIMTKSLLITHCRSDTPDGVPSVVRLPEITCDGSTYVFTYFAAILLFLCFGLGLPLWLGWQLYLRVDAPAAELENHSIWVGDPASAYAKTDVRPTKSAFVTILTDLKTKAINCVERLIRTDIDGNGGIGDAGDGAKRSRMWQRLFYTHLSAARAGFPSDQELIVAWEDRAGPTSVSESGVFEFKFDPQASAMADVQARTKAAARGLKSGLSRARSMKGAKTGVGGDAVDARFHIEEREVLSGNASSKNTMKAQGLRKGHIKAWLQHPDTEPPSSIAGFRSDLRDEDDYETLVRWAYENRIREVFSVGVTGHEDYDKVVAKQTKRIGRLDGDKAEDMAALLKQRPVLAVELRMVELMPAVDGDPGWSNGCLRSDLVKLDREKLCARAARDDVQIFDGDTDTVIIEKIVKAHEQILDSMSDDGATVLVPEWAVVTFKQPPAADFALDVAASFQGLTSSRTGSTETELVRMEQYHSPSTFGQHLRTIMHRFPTTLHVQAFNCEGAVDHRRNRVVWMPAQTLLHRYQKHQTAKVMVSLTAMLDAIGSNRHLTSGGTRGGGRSGSYLRSVYWGTVANGARSRRDWLLPMYAGVDERCWWWNAALLFRRTAIALFSSRRDGDRFQLFGTDSDWRAMVVLTLSINIFLSSVYRPYSVRQTNSFSDFSIVILLILYMFTTSGEKKFFRVIALLGMIVLLPTLVILLWDSSRRHRKTKEKWDRVRSAKDGLLKMTGPRGNRIGVTQELDTGEDRPAAATDAVPPKKPPSEHGLLVGTESVDAAQVMLPEDTEVLRDLLTEPQPETLHPGTVPAQ